MTAFTNNLFLRARVRKVDDSGRQQMLQLEGRHREMLGGKMLIPRLQMDGFSSHPVPGSHAVIFMPDGNPDNAVALGTEHGDRRPTGQAEGESKVYGPGGSFVQMRADGAVVIHAGKIILDGNVFLGSESASRPVSAQGTVDSGGFADTSNELTKVKGI